MSTGVFLMAGNLYPSRTHDVQTTIESPRTDGAAERDHGLDWNERNTDTSPQLVGLTPRQLNGDVHGSEQYVPFWIPFADQDHSVIIDEQISSSGTAAARESVGIFGHGTAEYTDSIEPTIREGGAYGNDYFVVNSKDIQEGAGDYLTSPVSDTDWQGVAQAIGVTRAREASQANYDAFFAGV